MLKNNTLTTSAPLQEGVIVGNKLSGQALNPITNKTV